MTAYIESGAGIAAGGRTGLTSLVTAALFLLSLFFLTIILMPLATSVTKGVAFGALSYALLKLASGRGREVDPLLYAFAALVLGRYLFIR